ncbi:MAG: hypothetical protein OHK0021_22110 [Bryobacter sp.]
MEFLRAPRQSSRRLALFAGAFHPPTVAHRALAEAALAHVDETVWVIPRMYPHKQLDDVPFPTRCEMLLEVTDGPVALAEANYFFPMAEELAAAVPGKGVNLLLGEDGAHRLFSWNYGLSPEATREFLLRYLQRFPLLTARRAASPAVPLEYEQYLRWLVLPQEAWEVSATEVRRRISAGEDWASLVPAPIRASVARYYGSSLKGKGQ